jgi:hypothetical protein
MNLEKLISAHDPSSLSPKLSKKVDSMFVKWLVRPQSQEFIQSQIHDLTKQQEFKQNISEKLSLMAHNISKLGESNFIPQHQPNRDSHPNMDDPVKIQSRNRKQFFCTAFTHTGEDPSLETLTSKALDKQAEARLSKVDSAISISKSDEHQKDVHFKSIFADAVPKEKDMTHIEVHRD